jgi:hypothetical protein
MDWERLMIVQLRNFGGAIGLFGGISAWYAAHELSFFLLRVNCTATSWLVPAIHALAFAAAVISGLISFQASLRTGSATQRFITWLGIGSACLFGMAILWQGAATLIYTGCER